MNTFRRPMRTLSLLVLLVAGIAITAGAVRAQTVTQGYATEENLQRGMLVRLKKGNPNQITSLTKTEASEMLGVVVSANDAPVTLSDPDAPKQAFVATFGKYEVLVSNESGTVKKGDLITVSSLNGVAMRATTQEPVVLGKALGDFTAKNDTISSTKLKGAMADRTVNIGRIQVDISISNNPLFQIDKISGVPGFLGKAVRIVTDRPVSAVRVYMSMAVLLVALLLAGFVVYSGIRTGMTAVGRNPLAKKSITHSMVQVILAALIIFIIGMIAVYLLLKL